MTFAYRQGYLAALRSKRNGNTALCPYGGHNDGSMKLQTEWRNGWFDGLTAPIKKRVSLRPRKHVTRRRQVRSLPRSQYAKTRIQSIIATWGEGTF